MSNATATSISSSTTLRATSEYLKSSPPLASAELHPNENGSVKGHRDPEIDEYNLPHLAQPEARYDRDGLIAGKRNKPFTDAPRFSPISINGRHTLASSPPVRSKTVSSNGSHGSSSRYQPTSPSRARRKRASTMTDQQPASTSTSQPRFKQFELKGLSSPAPRSASVLHSIYNQDDSPSHTEEYARNHTTSPGRRYRASELASPPSGYGNLPRSTTFGDFSSGRITPYGANGGVSHRSGVWDELESVKERLQRLKVGSVGLPSDATTTTTHTSPLQIGRTGLATRGVPRRGSLSSQDPDSFDFSSPQKSVSPILKSPNNRRTESSYSTQQYRSRTPTQAEQYLRDVLERARKEKADINIMLLDRTASDLLAVYSTNCDPQQIEAIDRACVSLASFILQTLDAVNNSATDPSQFSPPGAQNPVSRFRASRAYTSNPGSSVASLSRAASTIPFASDLDYDDFGRGLSKTSTPLQQQPAPAQHQHHAHRASYSQPLSRGITRATSMRSSTAGFLNDYSTPSKLGTSQDSLVFQTQGGGVPRSLSQTPGGVGSGGLPVVRRYGSSRRTHSTLHTSGGAVPSVPSMPSTMQAVPGMPTSISTMGLSERAVGMGSSDVRRKRHSLTFI